MRLVARVSLAEWNSDEPGHFIRSPLQLASPNQSKAAHAILKRAEGLHPIQFNLVSTRRRSGASRKPRVNLERGDSDCAEVPIDGAERLGLGAAVGLADGRLIGC